MLSRFGRVESYASALPFAFRFACAASADVIDEVIE